MVSVGKRLQEAIKYLDKGEIELALTDVCIALDITSQAYYGASKSSRSNYEAFLKEHMWMIIPTGMGSIVMSSLKIPFQHSEIKSDGDGYCTLEQIVYHVMRCGLVHSTGEESKIVWDYNVQLAIPSDHKLHISPSFIWGFMLAIITCSVNKDERVDDLCWISTSTFKYLINDLWGKKESVMNMIKSTYGIDPKQYL